MPKKVSTETVTVGSMVSIMFFSAEMNSYTICKVEFGKLNWKLRKLQKEKMSIIGVYFDGWPPKEMHEGEDKGEGEKEGEEAECLAT